MTKYAWNLLQKSNVMVVRWTGGSNKEVGYFQAASNTRVVGKAISMIVKTLIARNKAAMNMTTLVGFSLGAHTSGYAGADLPGLRRIIGRAAHPGIIFVRKALCSRSAGPRRAPVPVLRPRSAARPDRRQVRRGDPHERRLLPHERHGHAAAAGPHGRVRERRRLPAGLQAGRARGRARPDQAGQ